MRAYKTSGNIARSRLEYMLLSDKTQLDPEIAAQMKRELGSVIRRHLNAEHARLDVEIRLISETARGEEHVKTIQIKGL